MSSAFVIASLKLLILQATTTKNDIATSAVAIVCFLAGYGFFISQGRIYLFMLLTSVLFGFTVKTYFPGFSIPFLLFLTIILLRAYPIKKIVSPLKGLLEDRVLLIIAMGLFFCMGSNWINNYLTFGNIQGEIALIQKHANKDFLVGMLANAFRYSLQLFDLPSNYYNDIIVNIHDQIMGEFKNISLLRPYPFYLHNNFPPEENCSWYGPLAASLIVPSVLYAAVKGKGYIRVISFSLLSFFLVACYSMVWMRGSSRYFCIFFACSGVPLAFFLKNIIATKNLRIFILIVMLLHFFIR